MYNEDTIEPEQRGHGKLLHKGKSASSGPSTMAGDRSLLKVELMLTNAILKTQL